MLTVALATLVYVAVNYVLVATALRVTAGHRPARVVVWTVAIASGAVLPWLAVDATLDVVRPEA